MSTAPADVTRPPPARCCAGPCCSAKVVVVGPPKSALPTLSHHLGLDLVPAAWGGRCTMPFDAYPAHTRMMAFARRLNAGEDPLSEVLAARAAAPPPPPLARQRSASVAGARAAAAAAAAVAAATRP